MPPERRPGYQYSLRFDPEQMALVSALMASTGLNLVGVIRLALTRLSKTELGPAHETPGATIEPKTGAGTPDDSDGF
jgi:hypothetical protein